MATKKSSRPNKSAFIRALPAEMTAAEAIEKGKAAGLTFSANFVSAIRSKVRTGTKGKVARKPVSAKGQRGPKPKTAGMSASDFVRSMPASMKPADVLAAAKAKGIKMSRNLIYAVRTAAKKKVGAAPSAVRGRPRKAARAAAVGAPKRDVSEFKKMALELGISMARQALDELERGLATLLV